MTITTDARSGAHPPRGDRPAPAPDAELVTVREIAARFGVGPLEVIRWRAGADDFPAAVVRAGAPMAFRADEVQAWAATRGIDEPDRQARRAAS